MKLLKTNRWSIQMGVAMITTKKALRVSNCLLAAGLTLCCMLWVGVPRAGALELESVGGSFTDPVTGAADFQAGAHPDLRVRFSLSTRQGAGGMLVPDGSLRTVQSILPPGIVGNPAAIATCTREGLLGQRGTSARCPIGAQIGVAKVMLEPGAGYEPVPVYNLERPSGTPGEFGFNIYGQIVRLVAGVRPGDYAVEVDSTNTSQVKGIAAFEVTMWGVPGDPIHNPERFDPDAFYGYGEWGAESPVKPTVFLTSSTSCSGGPLTTTLRANSWQEPTVFSTQSFSTDLDGNPIVLTGCDRLGFAPSLNVQTTARSTSTPTGLTVDLRVPQNGSPAGLATAHVRDVTMVLPRGMSVSPPSAAGLAGCTPAQIGLGVEAEETCPASSRLGTVEIDTPLLEEAMRGEIILAQPHQNPFGSLLSLYIVAEGGGVTVKLPGKVEADPETGRLTVTFANNPQLPFSELKVQLDGGPNASLVTPDACGQYPVSTQITSWSGKSVTLTSPMSVNQGCVYPAFAPEFRAGVNNPVAGSDSAFGLDLVRGDGSPWLATLQNLSLPKGLLARVGSASLCGESDANQGSCPSGSRLGDVQVSAGAGSQPLWVPQVGSTPTSVSLTGPYRGAPYGLSIVVPAQAGPFDLGRVVVRSALHVDAITTQLTTGIDESRVYDAQGRLVKVIAGAMPTILEGIPLDVRELRVNVDRPNFVVNPTNCSPQYIAADALSVGGERAALGSHFQVADCAALAFKPKLALRLSGAPTRRGGYPKLRAVLTMPQHGANIQRAQVLLPKTEFLENAHIRTICTRVQYAAGNGGGAQCPPASIYGYAKAWSPLLDQPIQGPVYLRSSNHKLPDLVASLDGQIHIDLVGRIDAKRARIRNTFETVPDAPVSRFVLTMQGGKKGLLVNNTNICKAKPRADVRFDGQNGKPADSRPLVKVAKCAKKRK